MGPASLERIEPNPDFLCGRAVLSTRGSVVCRKKKSDFLEYTFGRCYSIRRSRVYLARLHRGNQYSAAALISDETGRAQSELDPKSMVEKLNRMPIG